MSRDMQDIVIRPERHRWFVWRDIVTLLLAVTVVMLVMQVADLRGQLDNAANLRTRQLAEVNQQLDELQAQLLTAQQQNTEKDRRIKQLTDQLLKAGLAPVRATAASDPRPVPSPSGPRPAPVPRTTPSLTPTPGPSPTPSPTCTPLPVVGTCHPRHP